MKKITYIIVATIASASFTACDKKVEDKPATVDNRQEMKDRFTVLNDCFNTGNSAAIDTLLAAEVIDHSEDTAMHLPPGPAGLKQLIAIVRESTPDLKSEIKMMTAEGDLLMVYGTMSGTNTGPMMGMPATGKKYSYDFVDVIKFGDDMKMKEHWGVYDNMKMMSDLGLMGGPPKEEPKKKSK